MTPDPQRDTASGRAYLDLRSAARQAGRDPSEYFTLYALEGLLARLAASGRAADVTLKGGVLMAALADRRPTRDIDLAATNTPNDIGSVERFIVALATTPLNDGLEFDESSVTGEVIRDDAEYPGVRVRLTARLARARISVHVDFSFGDPIWPGPRPTTLPRLLGGTIQLPAYPLHMVLAEKIVTALDRGRLNTRWRDFVDVLAIADKNVLTQKDLAQAVEVVATHRAVEIQPLSDALRGMSETAQPKWSAWRRKLNLEEQTPAQFADALDRYAAFADPVLTGAVDGRSWSPATGTWV